jgi:integrase
VARTRDARGAHEANFQARGVTRKSGAVRSYVRLALTRERLVALLRPASTSLIARSVSAFDPGMASALLRISFNHGKNRTVFLLEPAQRALELAPDDSDWVWPAIQGGRRAEGKAPRGWHRWVKAAKLRRRVRWHDLRHTCATSLLAGWWGRKWSLDEVLSDARALERQSHRALRAQIGETMRLAVAETLFPKSSPLLSRQIAKTAGKMRSRFRDLNSRPAVYETAGLITQTEPVWAFSAE